MIRFSVFEFWLFSLENSNGLRCFDIPAMEFSTRPYEAFLRTNLSDSGLYSFSKPLPFCPHYNMGASNLAERTNSLKKNDRWV